MCRDEKYMHLGSILREELTLAVRRTGKEEAKNEVDDGAFHYQAHRTEKGHSILDMWMCLWDIQIVIQYLV